ncbi:hypothetical protein MTO96_040672 [Rhipicephalus appendiculatus]
MAVKSTTVPVLPEDCPRLPAEDAEALLQLEDYLNSPEKLEKLDHRTPRTVVYGRRPTGKLDHGKLLECPAQRRHPLETRCDQRQVHAMDGVAATHAEH